MVIGFLFPCLAQIEFLGKRYRFEYKLSTKETQKKTKLGFYRTVSTITMILLVLLLIY